MLQPHNGIFIFPWYEDPEDMALAGLTPLLEELIVSRVRVPDLLEKYREQIPAWAGFNEYDMGGDDEFDPVEDGVLEPEEPMASTPTSPPSPSTAGVHQMQPHQAAVTQLHELHELHEPPPPQRAPQRRPITGPSPPVHQPPQRIPQTAQRQPSITERQELVRAEAPTVPVRQPARYLEQQATSVAHQGPYVAFQGSHLQPGMQVGNSASPGYPVLHRSMAPPVPRALRAAESGLQVRPPQFGIHAPGVAQQVPPSPPRPPANTAMWGRAGLGPHQLARR